MKRLLPLILLVLAISVMPVAAQETTGMDSYQLSGAFRECVADGDWECARVYKDAHNIARPGEHPEFWGYVEAVLLDNEGDEDAAIAVARQTLEAQTSASDSIYSHLRDVADAQLLMVWAYMMSASQRAATTQMLAEYESTLGAELADPERRMLFELRIWLAPYNSEGNRPDMFAAAEMAVLAFPNEPWATERLAHANLFSGDVKLVAVGLEQFPDSVVLMSLELLRQKWQNETYDYGLAERLIAARECHPRAVEALAVQADTDPDSREEYWAGVIERCSAEGPSLKAWFFMEQMRWTTLEAIEFLLSEPNSGNYRALDYAAVLYRTRVEGFEDAAHQLQLEADELYREANN